MAEAPRLDALIAYVASLEGEHLSQAFLEDIALCAAWLESYRDQPEILAAYPELPTRVGQWVTLADPTWSASQSMGSRQQPVLRLYVNELIRGRVSQLARDELDFLYFAWVLSERSQREGLFERSLECLRPFAEQIEKLRAQAPLCPGMPHVASRVAHFGQESLKQAEPRDVKVFAGIDAPVRGPALSHAGDCKILGGIPESCAVVVEEGSAYVRGPVHGKLAATRNCEILGAVSGIVVSQRGHVRAGALYHPARVVAKEANVAFLYGENPRIVFAALELSCARGAIGGCYRANDVAFEGTVQGGEIQVAGKLKATRLEATEERPLSVVLRRSLSCKDYGEVLTLESSRLLTAAMRIRQRVNHLRELMELTDREADEYAGSVIRFIMGSDTAPVRAQNVQQIRRAGAFIDRLEIALESLLKTIEEQLDAQQQEKPADASDDTRVDVRILVEDLESDLGLLIAEGPLPREVTDFKDVVVKAARQVQRAFITEAQIIAELQGLLALRERLEKKRDELEALELAEGEPQQTDTASQAAVLEKARQNRAQIEVLQKLLEMARRSQGSEHFRRCCNDRFVKLMQRNIEHRRARVIEYAANVRKFEADIESVRARLWRDYRVTLPRHVVENVRPVCASVEAAFSGDVRIVAWPHLVEARSAEPGQMIIMRETGEEKVIVTRTPEGSVKLVVTNAPERPRRRSRDRAGVA